MRISLDITGQTNDRHLNKEETKDVIKRTLDSAVDDYFNSTPDNELTPSVIKKQFFVVGSSANAEPESDDPTLFDDEGQELDLSDVSTPYND